MHCARRGGVITSALMGRQQEKSRLPGPADPLAGKAPEAMKKPQWVVEKEQARKARAQETLWLFGLHAVRDALMNPVRERLRLVVTRNAADRLADAIAAPTT